MVTRPSANQENSVALRLRMPDSGMEEVENSSHHVTWDPGVVDNEGAGRKKSNKCCIYHEPKAYDESESESDESESEELFRKRYPEFAGKSNSGDKEIFRNGHRHSKDCRKRKRPENDGVLH